MSRAAMCSAALKARVRRPSLWNKLHTPEELLHHFPPGAYIGWSGFTGTWESSSLPFAGWVA